MTLARSAAVLLFCLVPRPAWAHAFEPGIGGGYAAFIHTLTEMPAPLTLVSLGLLWGMHGAAGVKWAWAAFLTMMVAAMGLYMGYGIVIDPIFPMLLLAMVAGLYAASGLPLAPTMAVGFAAIGGYLLGIFITPPPAPLLTVTYAIAGGVVAANFIVVLTAIAVDVVRTRWPTPQVAIAIRVIASWITAIAALMVSLAIK